MAVNTQLSTKGLKRIGKGAFTTCYALDDKTVILKSVDPVKECLANGWFPKSPLFPSLEFVGAQGDDRLYKMERFKRGIALNRDLKPSELEVYKQLKQAFDRGCNIRLADRVKKDDMYYMWITVFKKIKNRRVRGLMLEALDAVSNWGTDIGFEISPRNIAVKNGKLVLLDVFFKIKTLEKVTGRRIA